jgi:hypothetical protein
MKISDTSFVVPLRRSDAHIWSSANEPEFGKVANAKFIAHYAGHEVRSDLSACCAGAGLIVCEFECVCCKAVWFCMSASPAHWGLCESVCSPREGLLQYVYSKS